MINNSKDCLSLLTHQELINVYKFYHSDKTYKYLTFSQLISYLNKILKLSNEPPFLSNIFMKIPYEIQDLLIAIYYYINHTNDNISDGVNPLLPNALKLKHYQNINEQYYKNNNTLFSVYIHADIKLSLPRTYNLDNLLRLKRICRIISNLILNDIQEQMSKENDKIEQLGKEVILEQKEQGQIYYNNINKDNINLYEYLYKKLIKTYDTRLLLNYDLKIRQDMLGYIHSKDDNKLYNLIYNLINYYNDKFNNEYYISGVKSMVKLINTDKTIYIIGEHHQTRNACDDCDVNYQTIEDFLQNLIIKSPYFIDVFIEYDISPDLNDGFSYLNGTKYNSDGFPHLENNNASFIAHKFNNPDGFLCKNMRLHKIDPRNIPKQEKSRLMLFYEKLYNMWISNDNISKEMIIDINKYDDIFEILYNCNNIDDLINIIKKEIYENVYIKKILFDENIHNEKIINFIMKTVHKQINKYSDKYSNSKYNFKYNFNMIKQWVKIINDPNLSKENLNQKNINILHNIAEYLILWFSSLIDVYAIFSIINPNNKVGNNMIISCGDAHRKILSEVLCGLFGYKIYNKIKDYDNCLKIEDLKIEDLKIEDLKIKDLKI
jgi:hypothetical protein